MGVCWVGLVGDCWVFGGGLVEDHTWANEKLANTTFLYKTRWSQKIGPGVPGKPGGRKNHPRGPRGSF